MTFSQKVRQYLIQKFNIGQDTGKKEDPAQVAKDMRTASQPRSQGTLSTSRKYPGYGWSRVC